MPPELPPSYAALVAALREEFDPSALNAMTIQLARYRHDQSSISVLARAVADAMKTPEDAGGALLAQILRRIEAVETKLAGVIKNHSLWDGS